MKLIFLVFVTFSLLLVSCDLEGNFAGEAFRFGQKEVDFDKKGREYLDHERDQQIEEAEAQHESDSGRSVEYGAQGRTGDGEQHPQEGQNVPGERDAQQQNIDGRRESGTTDTTCSGLKKRLGLCSEEITPQSGLDEPEDNGCTAEQAARGDCSINTGDVFGQDGAPGEDGGCTESQRRLGLCAEDEIEDIIRQKGSIGEDEEIDYMKIPEKWVDSAKETDCPGYSNADLCYEDLATTYINDDGNYCDITCESVECTFGDDKCNAKNCVVSSCN